MPKLPWDEYVEIRQTEYAGRGVFAKRSFNLESFFYSNPVIIFDEKDWNMCKGSILSPYVYFWPEDGFSAALALGLGSIFNHSDDPNIVYDFVVNKKEIRYTNIKPINIGDEITFDYDVGEKNETPFDKDLDVKSRYMHALY